MKRLTDLNALLLEARDRGYLGDQPIERQIEHSLGFSAVCRALLRAGPETVDGSQLRPAHRESQLLDLGAGGGIPGLVLALVGAPLVERIVLLDGSLRRAEWLRHAVELLKLTSTVEVLGDRAEVAGRMPSWRHHFSVVVARSFGRPAVAAECAAPLLDLGGFLIVSEPPSVDDSAAGATIPDPKARRVAATMGLQSRWPSHGVAELGFGVPAEWRAGGFRYAALCLTAPCPERYPRRTGIPAKRPLF